MSNELDFSRFFGGFDFGGMGFLLPIIVIFLLFSFGEEIFEFLFCDDNAIIWIVLLVLLFVIGDFGDGGGCGC
ncbi:MAG: hypothetical protein RSG52_04830 [Terrisporobacter sp.]|uniref:hypothetical protein n=1 Tax=Terrisporobacter sp. TaxID=1965305 RepID=UPI002FCAA8D3